MRGFFINQNGSYYEGDQADFHDIAVPQRPTQFSTWSGTAWVENVAGAQVAANAAIDNQAGLTRLKYITDVAGQSETYLSKATDAINYKAAAYPFASIASYPMVQAEGKAIYGATPTPTAAQYQAAADGILTQQAQWIQLAAAIEQQRRAGKIAVGAASTVAAVQAAQQAAIAALAAL